MSLSSIGWTAQIGLLDADNLPVHGIEESRKLQELVSSIQ